MNRVVVLLKLLFFDFFFGGRMYKLTSVGGVFELIDSESGEIVRVGDFEDCYSIIENTVGVSCGVE